MSGRYFLRNKRKRDSPIPAKITKQQCMDPFQKLPEDLHDLILKHFRVKELLELSLVSKSFNKAIGRSPYCMNRMALQIHRFQSKNKYVSYDDECLSAVLASSREYRTIKSFRMTLRDLPAISEKFSDSIRELWTSNDVKCVELPRLQALTVYSDLLPDGLLLTNMHHIDNLMVWEHERSSIKLLKKTLKSMSGHLRILDVDENVFDERLDFPKLESLTVASNNVSYAQLISIMADLPNLRSLTIRWMDIECGTNMRYEDDLPDNYSIKELDCYSEFAEKHLKAFRGLECFRAHDLYDELLDDFFSLPSLTKYYFEYLNDGLSKSEQLDIIRRMKEQKKIEFIHDCGSLDDLEAEVNSLEQ